MPPSSIGGRNDWTVVLHSIETIAALKRPSQRELRWSAMVSEMVAESCGGLTVSAQVRQSEGSGFKSRSGQIAYFHGAKTRLSTLGTGDVTFLVFLVVRTPP